MRLVRHAVPILGLLFLVAVPLAAQNGSVRGQVIDSVTRQPLAGVTVQIQGTPRSTATGRDGSYALGDVPAGSVVVRATRIGFAPRQQVATVTAGGTIDVQFEMSPQASLLEAIVVTGYGTQRREAITGSVASVDASAANVGVKTNVTQMIQGRAAGVEVIQNNGEPGAGAQILIRGGSSFNAKNDPLYVIDGVPINNVASEPDGNGWTGNPSLPRNPLNLINPADIASITVLKDASATAIYGSRASNGVILVETKRGQSAGGPTFEYDGNVSTSSPSRRLDVLSGSEYAAFVRQQVGLGNLDSARLGKIGVLTSTGPNPGDTARIVYNTNWENAITRSSVTNNHNLAFAGGSEDTRYRASLNYAKEQGVTLSSGLERIQGRLTANHSDLDGHLRVGLNVTSSRVNNTYLTYENQGGFEGGVCENVATFNPTQPVTVTDSTGTHFYEVGGTTIRNPVALANQITNIGQTTRTLGNAEAEYDLLHGLTAKINVGLDHSSGGRQEYYPIANPLGRALGNGFAQVQDLENATQTFQTLLTYDGQAGEGTSLNVVGGYEYSKFRSDWVRGRGIGFFTDAYSYHSLSAAVTQTSASSGVRSKLASFFGRANVGFHDRFFVTGVLRYDGSSRFAAGHNWALFPGLSGSWNLKQEGFMQGGPFSEFRVRVGWGIQGNPTIDPYTTLITLESGSGAAYPWGDTPHGGVLATSNGNDALKWEQTSQVDGAIDFGLWNNRISGTVEYYHKNTKDLLSVVGVPQPALVNTQLRNVGKLSGHGIELSLDALPISRPGLTWRAGLVFAADRNRVTDLGCSTDSTGVKSCPFYESGDVSGQGQSNVLAERIMVCDPSRPGFCPGYALGTFYGPIYLGNGATGKQEFFCTAATVGCVNGRTTTGGGPAAADYRVIGNANPSFTVGFHSQMNWNRFDVSFLVRAVVGQDVFNNTALVYSTKSNALQDKNFLRPALTDGTGIHEPAIYSSRWIESASFVRLQNITVGYDLNLPWLTRSARSARLYLSADNLILLTGYSGLDPEVYSGTGVAVRGVDYLVYPHPRTITGGLRLLF
ncbi:MAG: SusC/RagA family TonB-linked outer membrane protein [Chloroflexi bacterium]|nr:MAG: SusC/RagA family TonB-linked outer membrane protein [Chloroflexota bacterium]